MTVDQAIEIVRDAFTLMLMISAPILLAALIVGLTVSILQAVTQVQEQTLSFVPKILGMGIMAIFAFPWIVSRIMAFAVRMFTGH